MSIKIVINNYLTLKKKWKDIQIFLTKMIINMKIINKIIEIIGLMKIKIQNMIKTVDNN